MMLPSYDWPAIEKLPEGQLSDTVFKALQAAAYEIQSSDLLGGGVESLVPRLLELREKRPELKKFDEIIGTLARSVGLWNYLDAIQLYDRDKLIGQAARAKSDALQNRILHREQWNVFNALWSGRNVILSAPTSFGKSLLIDVLLETGRYKQVAIIVPTIALLDETRRRLLKAFGSRFDIVSNHSEVPKKERVVFIGTQERLIARDDLKKLDLLIVDEFYKLDPSRKDERSAVLNAAVYKLLNRSSQFFFLGPNIDSVINTDDNLWSFEFIKSRFSTVAVDTLDLRGVPDKEGSLLSEVIKPENWPVLIFASSPNKANDLLAKLNTEGASFAKGAKQLAAWVKENFWEGWPLASAIEKGCATHHGRLPRALAIRLVHEFGQGRIGALICTSTLIEGVNTSAKSVMIYDKKINKSNYDFFTFSNIRGRAGRLGHHYVGKVFLFNDAPDETSVDIDTPLFHDLNDAPDQLIVHFEQEKLTDRGSSRIEVIARQAGLSALDLQRFASIELEEIQKFNDAIGALMTVEGAPSWSGFPDYEEIEAMCRLICEIKPAFWFGAYSAKQLAFYLSRLMRSRRISEFYHWYGEENAQNPEKYDQIFKFLRSCEFGLGEYFTLIEALINNRRPGAVDFSAFVAAMKNLFRDESIKILDERGVPMQISEKVYRNKDSIDTLSERLIKAASNKDSVLTPYERVWVLSSLVY